MELSRADVHSFLNSIQPFKALGRKDLDALAAHGRKRAFAKDETIFNEGDEANSVWVLYQGRVQVFKYTSAGSPFAIESLGAGELFGTLCRMGGNGRVYPCTAVAAEDTMAIEIRDRIFVDFYMKSPGMLRGICTLCADRLKDVQDLRCMGQESVEVKLANILVRLQQVHGDIIPFTKKEISELIGVALETTFRALSELQKKGYLVSLRGKIHIKKTQELRSLIE